MLTCHEVLVLGSDYLDGALDSPARRRLRLHLLMCRHCRRYLHHLRLASATAGALPVPADETRVQAVLAQLPPAE